MGPGAMFRSCGWLGAKKERILSMATITHRPLPRAEGYAHGGIYGSPSAAANPDGPALQPGGVAAGRSTQDAAGRAGIGSGRICLAKSRDRRSSRPAGGGAQM